MKKSNKKIMRQAVAIRSLMNRIRSQAECVSTVIMKRELEHSVTKDELEEMQDKEIDKICYSHAA